MLRDLLNLIAALFCAIGYILATIFSQWLQKHPGTLPRLLWVAGLIFLVWRIVTHVRRLIESDYDHDDHTTEP